MLLSDFTQTPSAVGYGFGAGILHSGILLLPSAVGSFLGAPIGAALIRRSRPEGPDGPRRPAGRQAARSLAVPRLLARAAN